MTSVSNKVSLFQKARNEMDMNDLEFPQNVKKYIEQKMIRYDCKRDAGKLSEEDICTYRLLNDLIDECKFNTTEKTIIEELMYGHDLEFVAIWILQKPYPKVRLAYNNICTRIANMAKFNRVSVESKK